MCKGFYRTFQNDVNFTQKTLSRSLRRDFQTFTELSLFSSLTEINNHNTNLHPGPTLKDKPGH